MPRQNWLLGADVLTPCVLHVRILERADANSTALGQSSGDRAVGRRAIIKISFAWTRTVMAAAARKGTFERALAALTIVSLLLVRFAAFGIFADRLGSTSHEDFGASSSFVDVYCDPKNQSDGDAPAPAHHRHVDCVLCVLGGHASPLERAILLATQILFAFPRATLRMPWGPFDASAWIASGRPTSSPARAPPIVS